MDRGDCWQQEQMQHLDDESGSSDSGCQYDDDPQYGYSDQYGDGSDSGQYDDPTQYGDQYGDGSGQYSDQYAGQYDDGSGASYTSQVSFSDSSGGVDNADPEDNPGPQYPPGWPQHGAPTYPDPSDPHVAPQNPPQPDPPPGGPYRQQGSQDDSTWETVTKVVIGLGLSIAIVATVIAALADPEPATKLALAGLSVAEIEALGAALGFSTSDSGTSGDGA